MPRLAAALPAALLLAAPPPIAAPPPPDPGDCAGAEVDVLDHQATLTLTLAPPSLEGSGRVTVRTRRSGDLVALEAQGLEVTRAEVAGRPASLRAGPGRACIRLPAPAAAGARVALDLAWRARADGTTPRFLADQAWAGYATATWLPTVQDPAQRATLELRLVLPPGLAAAASGARSPPQPLPDGRVLHRFTLRRPAPPFLYAFAVGRFAEATRTVGPVTLRALGPPGRDLGAALERTAAALRFLEEATGAPFPGAEYQQVFLGAGEAQEAAGLALLGEEALAPGADPGDDWAITHEAAHQWFAWLVPCADFSDFWLNEGFATFLVGEAQRRRFGERAFEAERARWVARSARARARGRDAPISLAGSASGSARRGVPEAALQDRGITYFRGALALARLRRELGDRAFWAGVRRYVASASAAPEGGTTARLQRAMEEASGRPLGPWFERWIRRVAPEP